MGGGGERREEEEEGERCGYEVKMKRWYKAQQLDIKIKSSSEE